jgi:glutaredoxin
MPASVKVYGADWCPLTRRALSHLKDLGIRYEYTNIDEDREAAQWVAQQNGGKEKKPTIDIDGRILSEPTNHELDRALNLG